MEARDRSERKKNRKKKPRGHAWDLHFFSKTKIFF